MPNVAVPIVLVLSGSPSVANYYQDKPRMIKNGCPDRTAKLLGALTKRSYKRKDFGFGPTDFSHYTVGSL